MYLERFVSTYTLYFQTISIMKYEFMTSFFFIVLDLNNPKTFRDFTKPIGALNENRLKQLQVCMTTAVHCICTELTALLN